MESSITEVNKILFWHQHNFILMKSAYGSQQVYNHINGSPERSTKIVWFCGIICKSVNSNKKRTEMYIVGLFPPFISTLISNVWLAQKRELKCLIN